MFLKDFTIKSMNTIKNSERRKIVLKLRVQYPHVSEDKFKEFMPAGKSLTKLKVLTSKNELVDFFLLETEPIFFKLKDYENYVPTLSTLWVWPDLLLTFTMPAQVLTYLSSGADLMCPGILYPLSDKNHYAGAKKGDLVGVNTDTNCSVCAVGILLEDPSILWLKSKGKFIKILHFYQDKLWAMSAIPIPIRGSPVWLMMYTLTELSLSNEFTESISKVDNQENVPCTEEQPSSSIQIEENVIEPSSTEEMDQLIVYCFIKSLKEQKDKIKLPILVSTFFRNHMIPMCPKGDTIDIKKSSYKKLKNFLDVMANDKFLNYTDNKNVHRIDFINFNHHKISEFIRLPHDVIEDTVSFDRVDPAYEIIGYKSSTITQFLYLDAGYSRNEVLTEAELRNIISGYIRKYNLATKKWITPNPQLASVLSDNVEKIEWENMIKTIIQKSTPCYKEKIDVQANNKKNSPITMIVQNRKWNKKVTLVNNLEFHKIDPIVFARECQHGVGASTTISIPQGRKTSEVLIQGNQINFVYKLLTDVYKIKTSLIRGLEFAPKKKK